MVRILTLLFSLLLTQSVMALEGSANLDRNMGLLVGDNITMTVQLPVDSNQIDINSLPVSEQRYGHWLVVHDVKMHANTLTLFMQLVNVPAENRVVNSPELTLRTKDGTFVNVPALAMQIGSFMEKNQQASPMPKADVGLPQELQSPFSRQLIISLTVFIVLLVVWLAWHFGIRPGQRLPFANALFELNKMRLFGHKDTDLASRHLHHAFNSCAGRVVIHSQLDKLWLTCPWLDPIKADIDSFYADSSAHFFSPQKSVSKDFDQLLALVKACRTLEKMA